VGLIYFDACLLIYLIERHTRWGDAVASAMAQAGETRFGISPLVKCECLVGPIKRGDPVLREAYVELFDRFVFLAMPETVYLQAAELRARFGLRTPDALHLACAQHHRCAALWTNDDRMARASHGLASNVLGLLPKESRV
jgi:predicted nucleic acid-binding protein